MTCNTCGTVLAQGDRTCGFCGAPASTAESPHQSGFEPAVSPPPPPNPTPAATAFNPAARSHSGQSPPLVAHQPHTSGAAHTHGLPSGSTLDVHGKYRAERVKHEPPDAFVSDAVTAKVLLPHFLRTIPLMIMSFLLFIGSFLLAFGMALGSASSSGSSSSAEDGASFFLLTMFVIFVTWTVVLCIPLREPISEYGLLIEGRAPAQAPSYAWITRTHRERRSPFGVKLGRVTGAPVMLLSGERRVHAMIVVQTCGTDLYVGWSMWRSRSTVVVLAHLIRDIFQSSSHLSLASEMRTASNRALRELVHSLTREGVQAAIIAPPLSHDDAVNDIARLPDLTAGQPSFLVPSTTSIRG
ncbi:hypothetical protein HLB23_14225 [Nocardia uniformis]|uniref:Uncharacterized protein n=1 Tax=Nocardia uniformis TaxID=53432 RepID=A0A849C0M3_9NOCA|nr:hypothetical protein [Nocardia uniformis]NNH71006.1 hypothetical protein [Nocardia uniformis]